MITPHFWTRYNPLCGERRELRHEPFGLPVNAAQEERGNHLGVNPMSEIVRVVDAIAGQVGVRLPFQQVFPSGRQIG